MQDLRIRAENTLLVRRSYESGIYNRLDISRVFKRWSIRPVLPSYTSIFEDVTGTGLCAYRSEK